MTIRSASSSMTAEPVASQADSQPLGPGFLFAGKQPKIPLVDSASFKKAAKEAVGKQPDLPF
jgi:hypothetical protein